MIGCVFFEGDPSKSRQSISEEKDRKLIRLPFYEHAFLTNRNPALDYRRILRYASYTFQSADQL